MLGSVFFFLAESNRMSPSSRFDADSASWNSDNIFLSDGVAGRHLRASVPRSLVCSPISSSMCSSKRSSSQCDSIVFASMWTCPRKTLLTVFSTPGNESPTLVCIETFKTERLILFAVVRSKNTLCEEYGVHIGLHPSSSDGLVLWIRDPSYFTTQKGWRETESTPFTMSSLSRNTRCRAPINSTNSSISSQPSRGLLLVGSPSAVSSSTFILFPPRVCTNQSPKQFTQLHRNVCFVL
mmetsp:Transcript_82525/g.167256  ORF Transcript_82525/g.167256 Transcript_82525/m.167256 type:complete len:238 (+) Transcript_82525:4424-5137(+)